VTHELVERIVEEEYDAIRAEAGDAFADGHWELARDLFVDSALAEEYPAFLTLPAYAALLTAESAQAQHK
jgi:malate synthase